MLLQIHHVPILVPMADLRDPKLRDQSITLLGVEPPYSQMPKILVRYQRRRLSSDLPVVEIACPCFRAPVLVAQPLQLRQCPLPLLRILLSQSRPRSQARRLTTLRFSLLDNNCPHRNEHGMFFEGGHRQ